MKRLLSFVTIIALLMGLCSCGKKALTWQEQYDLGVRYLSEGNYEEAIIAFTAAIEIDPKAKEAYISIAEAYLAQGEIESAIEILRRGYQATASEQLERLAGIYEWNSPANANMREIADGISASMKSKDRDSMVEYLEDWLSENGLWGMGERRVDREYDNLGYDGEKFCDLTEGIGLLFNYGDQIYFGEIANGLPNGEGCMVVVQTAYKDEWYDGYGGVEYYWLEGQWRDGQSVGTGTIWIDHSRRHDLADPNSAFVTTVEASCEFGEQQIIETADVSVTLKTESGDHQFTYQIANGTLTSDGWTRYSDSISRACSAHADCRVSMTLYHEWDYRNPYFWNGGYPDEAHTAMSMFIEGYSG